MSLEISKKLRLLSRFSLKYFQVLLHELATLATGGRSDGQEPLHYHEGVYALIKRDGDLLVIRKSRGPYEGWLDLPGGSKEPGETSDVALERELHEELGARIKMRGQWKPFSLFVTADSKGRPIRFEHQGFIVEVLIHDGASMLPTKLDEDASEVLWVPISELQSCGDVSALLRYAMSL
jgi:8-oxo-dGTP pyrophosphatase MutT (NUDIX family)